MKGSMKNSLTLVVVVALVYALSGKNSFEPPTQSVEAAKEEALAMPTEIFWKSSGWKKSEEGAYKVVFYSTKLTNVEVHFVRQKLIAGTIYPIQDGVIIVENRRAAVLAAQYWIDDIYPDLIVQTE